MQDDAREIQLAQLLRLQRSDSRTGADACDEQGRRYELKTTTTKSVTTGRDLSPRYFERLRRRYLVVAKGANTEFGFEPKELWFLSPEMLADWMRPYEDKWARLVGLSNRVLGLMRASSGFCDDELEEVRKVLERGLTINNPKIPMKYVRTHGRTIAGPDPSGALRALADAHPLAQEARHSNAEPTWPSGSDSGASGTRTGTLA